MHITFTVIDDKIQTENRVITHSGNVKTYVCAFLFSEYWDNFTKTALFTRDDVCYAQTITDGECVVPHEAISDSGTITVGVVGIIGDDFKRISTNVISVYVAQGAYTTDTTEPLTPSPDLWEQYIAQIQSAIDRGHAKIAENGNWLLWDAEAQEFTDSGLPSRGIQGDKGDKGDTGATGADGYTPQKGIDYFTGEDIESLGIDTKADKESVYTKTESDTALNTKADKQNEYGGFEGGINASANTGFAGGAGALTIDGGAAGDGAKSIDGGAVGLGAMSSNGGAVGRMAITSNGFAGGDNAKTVDDALPIDAIQLGTGTNPNPQTLQIYQHTLMDADGSIPDARIPQLTAKADKANTYTKTETDTALGDLANLTFIDEVEYASNDTPNWNFDELQIGAYKLKDTYYGIKSGILLIGDGAQTIVSGEDIKRRFYMVYLGGGSGWSDWFNVLDKSDIVDDVESENSRKALSAKQGKLLNDAIAGKADTADVYTKTESDGLLATKVDKVDGKGLSTNDYTATDKSKVNQLPETIVSIPIRPWALIEDYTVNIEEGIAKYNKIFPAGAKYSEVYIEVANMITVPATTDTIKVRIGVVGLEVWQGTMPGRTDTTGIHNPQFSAYITISPSGLLAANATASKYSYALLGGTSYRNTGTGPLENSTYSKIEGVYFQVFDYPMASGTRIRVYGR